MNALFLLHGPRMQRTILRGATALLLAVSAFAGEGHDHGEAPAAAGSPTLPRFAAQSELFEAVGVLKGKELSILIDHFDSNAPVLGAKVELESGSAKLPAAFHADHGDYSAPGDAFSKPGTYAITLTVTAADQTDLLAAEMVVPYPEAAQAGEAATRPWLRWTAWLAALPGLALLTVLALRKWGRRPSTGLRA